jgi:hypothetical protein
MKKYFGETKHIRIDNNKSKQDDYKWFTLQDGDVVPEEVESLVLGKEEKAKEKVEDKPKVKKGILNRIKDVAEDLLDDGKRNYSNDPNKKSPGRKPKKKGGKK